MYDKNDATGKEFEIVDIPENMKAEAQAWHDKMIEAVAELDEDLTMKYLEGEEISVEELKTVIRRETNRQEIFSLYSADLHTRTRVFR